MKIGYGVKQVFLKEIRELARDRRVLQASIVMPVFIIAIFVMIMGVIQESVVERKAVEIAVVGSEKFGSVNLPGMEYEINSTPVVSWEEGLKLLREKEVQAVLDTTYINEKTLANANARAKIGYSSDDALSPVAIGVIKQSIAHQNNIEVKKKLTHFKVDESFAEPIKIDEVNFSKDKAPSGSNIISLLPYLIILWAFYGGMSIVSDLVAGEKERGTMETLLVSPVRRAAVALGKIFSLMVVCFVSSLTTLVAVFAVAKLNLPMTKTLFPSGLSVQFIDVLAALILLISLVSFFATMLVSICAYSRNIREAQTYLGLLSFVIILPAIFSQIIGFTGMERALWVQWTPILNTAVLLKSLISGEGHYAFLGPALLENFAFAAIFLRLSIQLFRREEIVLRV
ncbi:MAG: ABC transporter permease [Fimbriimonadaceae bacterium]|nr:MAG: ABC transporter permease [Fimbriimonadaceae bacterium]